MASKRCRQAEQTGILGSKLKWAEEDYIKHPSSFKLKEIATLCSALDSLSSKEDLLDKKMLEHEDKAGK